MNSLSAQPVPPNLFTTGDDDVDFGVLHRSDFPGQTTNGLGGNDKVFLPDTEAGLVEWGLTGGFSGGEGNDEISAGAAGAKVFGDAGSDLVIGGAGRDTIDGGDDDDFLSGGPDLENDIVNGGAGNDWVYHIYSHDRINGGDGNDSFYIHQLNSLTDAEIDGGFGYDVLYINAALENLTIETSGFMTRVHAPGMTDWLELAGIEEIIAAEVDAQPDDRTATFTRYSISNDVFPVDRDLADRWEGAVIAEMAALSNIAYNAGAGFLPPHGWRGFEAIELGMHAYGFTVDDYAYNFIDGVYKVQTNHTTGAEGSALVLFGEIEGISTIVVAFRGTKDLLTDFVTYNFSENYQKFKPLIEAIQQFAIASDIEQILLTGHSMGAALAQTALGQSFGDTDEWGHVRAITFASPGGDEDQTDAVPGDRIITFNRHADIIPAAAATPLKEIVGPVITLGTVNRDSVIPILADHDPGTYAKDLADLSMALADEANLGFHNEPVAQTLRAGVQWTGENLNIALGNEADNQLRLPVGRAWDYVLGGGGNDTIFLGAPTAGATRLVDGGAGGDDQVVLIAFGAVTQTGIAEDFHLSVGGASLGRFVGVESYVVNGQLFYSNGRSVSVQAPTPGAATFALLDGYDMADTGDGALTVIGTGNADTIAAGVGNKTISAGAGDDLLFVRDGGAAAAGDRITLDGGAGADLMIGGSGNERLLVDQAGDVAAGGDGIDTVEAATSYTLPDDIENLVLLGAASEGIGNALANSLTGNGAVNLLYALAGNDRLDGGAGADSLVGGTGDDQYMVDHPGDQVTELAGEGTDRIFAGVSYTLGAGVHVESLTTTDNFGTAAINLTGNELANVIYGNAGANILDGRAGADTLVGLGGNDFYLVDHAADRIVEGAGQGTDRIFASVSYALGAGVHVESLTTNNNAGTAAINLSGNDLGNTLYGNAGNNILDGKGGADTLVGLGGNDFYHVDHASDRIVEATNEGTDRIFASTSYVLGAGVHVESLTTSNNAGTGAINLTGNELANTIFGNAGANVLDGKAGADNLIGFGGNDHYHVDHAGDRIVEAANEGTADRVFASLSYTLGAGVHVELMTTNNNGGTAAINLTGNELANTIYGNAGANVLDGRAGADTLIGFAGNDWFHVDHAADRIVEAANEGTADRVFASTSYTLGAGVHVELMTTNNNSGTVAINLTGNELVNTIYGNAGANILDGKGGADALVGFGGADQFRFSSALGGGNVDRLVDFVSGTDRILLDDAIFAALAPGALSAAAFVTGTQAKDGNDRIIHDGATGRLFYDADGSGAGAALLFATLDGKPALAASDFTVI